MVDWGSWYVESEHPRGRGGRWTSKGISEQAARPRQQAAIEQLALGGKKYRDYSQARPAQLDQAYITDLSDSTGDPTQTELDAIDDYSKFDGPRLNKRLRDGNVEEYGIAQEIDSMMRRSSRVRRTSILPYVVLVSITNR